MKRVVSRVRGRVAALVVLASVLAPGVPFAARAAADTAPRAGVYVLIASGDQPAVHRVSGTSLLSSPLVLRHGAVASGGSDHEPPQLGKVVADSAPQGGQSRGAALPVDARGPPSRAFLVMTSRGSNA